MSIKYNLEKNSSPWIEKYRPTSINELLLDNCTMNKVKLLIKKIISKHNYYWVPGLKKQQQFYV